MSDRDRFDVEEGQEVVRHTIVGGRPRARRKRRITIPIGLEKVLARAAGDPGFRRRLFEDRQAALAGLGWELVPSEAIILGAVPDGVLATLIDRIDLKQHAKRRFLKGIATAAFATAAMTSGVTCVGCGDVATKGIAPDDVQADVLGPSDVLDVEETAPSRGILPEVDVPDVIKGIEPDEVLLDPGPPPDAGILPEEVEAEEVMPAGILPETPEVIDVTDDQPAVGGILPEVIDEVEVDQGQNDGGVRPDLDTTPE